MRFSEKLSNGQRAKLLEFYYERSKVKVTKRSKLHNELYLSSLLEN